MNVTCSERVTLARLSAYHRATLRVPAEQATVSGVREGDQPSKSKEGAQREMGQTGTPHGVPLSGNGMSPATGGLWDLGCCWLFQPRPGGNLRGSTSKLSTDSRTGTPVVNARLHLTPNPRSTPGTNRTVRLAHHVGHQADLAESRLNQLIDIQRPPRL